MLASTKEIPQKWKENLPVVNFPTYKSLQIYMKNIEIGCTQVECHERQTIHYSWFTYMSDQKFTCHTEKEGFNIP